MKMMPLFLFPLVVCNTKETDQHVNSMDVGVICINKLQNS